MSGKYPQMLYKQGDQAEVFEEKIKVDTCIVKDDAEFAEAIADGWHEHPAATKHAYQEGGDPPTPEGGYPVDHQWDKATMGQAGRADRFEGLPEKEQAERDRKEAVTLPLGNPPRHEDPSVPGPAAETEGADALKKKPGERTAEAMKEFVEQAEKADEELGGPKRGRPRKTEEEKKQDDERADFGRSPADAAARAKK